MLYAQRSRHGIWKYRRAIPQALRLAAGRREINVTLCTSDDREAQLAYVKAHGEAEAYLKCLSKLAANPKSANGDKEIWELSKAYMRQIKLPYVPLADLKAQESFDDGPSQLEQRLDYVETKLGIDIDDPRTRDRQIEASWKAKAILGALTRPQFCMSDALRVYFDQRAPELAAMSPRQSKRYRLDKERAINSLQDALGENKPHEKINRSDARTLRDYFRSKGLANRALQITSKPVHRNRLNTFCLASMFEQRGEQSETIMQRMPISCSIESNYLLVKVSLR